MNQGVIYVFFAVIATLGNIGTQFIFDFAVSDQLFLSMLAGTLAGLVLKYELDRRYLFKVQRGSVSREASQFSLYSFFGILTTLLFWLTEWLFTYTFAWQGAKYIGAVIGLALGYWIKYQLDRKYVFV